VIKHNSCYSLQQHCSLWRVLYCLEIDPEKETLYGKYRDKEINVICGNRYAREYWSPLCRNF